MQRQLTFGGGVSPRGILLRGQSIIEYVLIIAVIGLVIVFAGPGVAGAIRNQFNLVGNTVNNGTSAGSEGGGATGGGSTGADSATVQAAVAKDAKDWTLEEQKAVAEDIAAKGEASPAFAKAKAAMDAGTRWSIKLTDGSTMGYRIVGINHDDLADGSGKAGLTFEATDPVHGYRFSNVTNTGGWKDSINRQEMNSGRGWNLIPSALQEKIKTVNKVTDNCGNEKPGNPTVTNDKMFLLSVTEVYGDLKSDGTQYEYYRDKGVTKDNCSGAALNWGNSPRATRSVVSTSWRCYWGITSTDGSPYDEICASEGGLNHPAWCF